MRQNSGVTNIQTLFSGQYIDRLAELRSDARALHEAFVDPHTRFLVLWKHLCLTDERGAVFLGHDELSAFEVSEDSLVFLGKLEGQYLFAIAIDADDQPVLSAGGEFNNLRHLSNTLDRDSLGLLAYARAMIIWQERHRFCGLCGRRNQQEQGGFVLVCGNDGCAQRVFPRLDPAIIVLVNDNDRCLLGRQASWPEGRFSTIAGFVEPGESLEDAVRREVHEETNISVGECRYLASQPWPFPSSLMIGYHATATSFEIQLNDKELAEARWVSRADIEDGNVVLPPKMSVAYRLIEAWYDEGGGPSLESRSVPAPPLG